LGVASFWGIMSTYQIKSDIEINGKKHILTIRTRGDGIYLWLLRDKKERFIGKIKQYALDDLLNVLPSMKSKSLGWN
jgi:hypothetical protein